MINSQVDEIKAKLNVEEVISGYLQLQRAGRNWKAKCPFHNEKTPSFTVSPERQMWYCFGCNEGGDIFTFVMKMEGLEFVEALKLLADKAGVQLESYNIDKSGKKSKVLEILDISRKFYQECLKIKNGKKAHEYLINRGLDKNIIEKFQLGYAPDSWDLQSVFLKKKGYKESDIFAAGQIIKKDSGGYYDRFRNRIMFPINNISGQTIGFSSRVMPGADESQAKYINTPDTIVYNKGRVLYGLDKAKTAIRQKDLCIMVEGNMDVIASFQAGVENVAAASGTAFTEEQVRIIKRYTKNIAFSFDADSAGARASDRAIEMALAEGMNVRAISIPEGKDPADCVKSNPRLWVDATLNPKPIMEFYFDSAFSKHNSQEVEGKKKIAEELLKIVSNISNKIEQNYYLKMLSEKLEIDEKAIFESLSELEKSKSRFQNKNYSNNSNDSDQPTEKNKEDREIKLQRKILGFMILSPHLFGDLFLGLNRFLKDNDIKKVYEMISDLYAKNNNKLTIENLAALKKEISQKYNFENQGDNLENKNLDISVEVAYSNKSNLSNLWDTTALAVEMNLENIDSVEKEAETCVVNLKKIVLKKNLKNLEAEIKKLGNDITQQKMEEFNKCAEELNGLEGE